MTQPSEVQLPQEVIFSPVQQVEKFITDVWEHPLVNGDLRTFRQKSLDTIAENMRIHGVLPDQYAAIPAGSFRWAVDSSSDYDYNLIDFPEEHEKSRRRVDDPFENAQLAQIADIQFVEVVSLPVLLGFYTGTRAAILLTPDDYVAGNKEKVKATRLALLVYIARRGPDQLWDASDSAIRQYFNRFFKNWGEASGLSTKQSERAGRFADRLSERANQAHNPETWKRGFLDALENVRLPSFEIYRNAMEETNGALRLNPRFASVGIR